VDNRVFDGAWHIQDRFGLSWWDALIVSAALVADCRYLLTEDLQDAADARKFASDQPFPHDTLKTGVIASG
jgi:predicted nucleic acid-binding protein